MEADAFSRLCRDYLTALAPGVTLSRVLDSFADPEQRVEAMIPLVRANQATAHFLPRLDLIQEKVRQWTVEEEKNPDLERIVLERVMGLLGRRAIRNLVASFRMMRARGKGLPRKKSQELAVEPKAQLKYALAAEDFCQEANFAFPERAFEAGLHFDLIAAAFEGRQAAQEARKALDPLWEEALRTARLASSIGATARKLELGGYLFGAGLLIHTGKALLGGLFPKSDGDRSWFALAAQAQKVPGWRLSWAAIAERKRFGLTHAEISACAVRAVGRFDRVAPAIGGYLYPSELTDRAQMEVATILSAAASLAQMPKDTRGLTPTQVRLLKKIGADPSAISGGASPA